MHLFYYPNMYFRELTGFYWWIWACSCDEHETLAQFVLIYKLLILLSGLCSSVVAVLSVASGVCFLKLCSWKTVAVQVSATDWEWSGCCLHSASSLGCPLPSPTSRRFVNRRLCAANLWCGMFMWHCLQLPAEPRRRVCDFMSGEDKGTLLMIQNRAWKKNNLKTHTKKTPAKQQQQKNPT